MTTRANTQPIRARNYNIRELSGNKLFLRASDMVHFKHRNFSNLKWFSKCYAHLNKCKMTMNTKLDKKMHNTKFIFATTSFLADKLVGGG